MSSSVDAGYFSDGITEEIINALAKIRELKVTSRTSSFKYRNSDLSIPEIGEQLNVAVILEGSVRLSGEQIRITAQLIDVKGDVHFWSETFDRNMKEPFSVQDEVSLFIADRLREHLGHLEYSNSLVDSYNISLSTYKTYLLGRYHLMQLDRDNSLLAIDLFNQVIQEADHFPLPYLNINQAYAYMGTMGLMNASEAFSQAEPYLKRGIELGPDLPETQLNLAWVSCWQRWDLKSAYQHLNVAIETKPTDEMFLTMSNFYTVEDQLDEAMKWINRALELAPFSSMNLHYKGFLYYLLGQYNNALAFFSRSLEVQPDLPFPHWCIGACYLLKGDVQKAFSYFQRLPN
ncbi:MAG: hypothetical protein JJ975_16650, partial [Bacteroidia bacterium]|nr:hypothetical protein [Bacteroidia bacterium]